MDLTVAQTLATQSSPSAIVFGSLLLFFPVVPIAGMYVSLLLLVRHWLRPVRGAFTTERGVPVLYAAGAFAIFLLLGAYVTPRDFFLQGLLIALGAPLGAAFGIVVARLLRRLWSRSGGRRMSMVRIRQAYARNVGLGLAVVYLIGTVFLLLPTVINEVAWLPPRQIELADGRGFVGYEVSRTDEVVALLRDSDRKVVEVSSSEMVSAHPCRLVDLVNTAAPFMPFTRHFLATPACV